MKRIILLLMLVIMAGIWRLSGREARRLADDLRIEALERERIGNARQEISRHDDAYLDEWLRRYGEQGGDLR